MSSIGENEQPKSRLCSVRETCERLNFSRAQYYILLKQGKIRGIKVGGKRCTPESEIERIILEGVAA